MQPILTQEVWSRSLMNFFTPETPLANDAGMEALTSPRDYDKVKRDLAAAGYKGEKVVVLGVSDLAVLKAETDVGADMFQRMGMNVDFQAADWGTVVTRRANKGPASQGGWNVHYTGFNGIDFVNPVGHLPLRRRAVRGRRGREKRGDEDAEDPGQDTDNGGGQGAPGTASG